MLSKALHRSDYRNSIHEMARSVHEQKLTVKKATGTKNDMCALKILNQVLLTSPANSEAHRRTGALFFGGLG